MATETLKVEIEAYTDGYRQGLRDAWKETEEFTEKVEDSSKSVQNSSKQIGGAASVFIGGLAVKAISALIQAGIKGMDTMYQFSAETNGQFKQAMDDVYSSFQSVKTALGSTFATVLTALAPIISQICDLLIQAANAFSFFFAMLSGQSGYTKVTKGAAEYGAALGTAAGNAEKLKKSLLGIDEINALQDKSSSGGGGGGLSGGAVGDMEWVELTGISKDISTVMGKIKKTVGKYVSDYLGIIGEAFEIIGAWMQGDEEALQQHIENLYSIMNRNPIMRWCYNAAIDISNFFSDMWYGIKRGFWDFATAVVKGWGEICALFNNGEVPAGIQKTIDKMEETGRKMDDDHEKAKTLRNALRMTGDVDFDNTFHALNECKTITDRVTNSAWNLYSALSAIKSIGAINLGTSSVRSIALKALGFASGGYPDTGELFLARESGPEMVGTIGGRTAVANNNDIVAAVSEGVFQAVAQAMGNSGGTSSTEVNVYMDSEVVARAADRGNRSLNRRYNMSLA